MDEGKVDFKIGTQITRELNNWLEVISQKYEIVPTSDHIFATSIYINKTRGEYSREPSSYPAISLHVNFRIHLDAHLNHASNRKKLVGIDLKFKNETLVLVESWIERLGVYLDTLSVTILKRDQAREQGDVDIRINIEMLGPDGKRIPPHV